MKGTVKLQINNMEIAAKIGTTILETATIHGINIPSLCYIKGTMPYGACRICMVESNNKLVTACSTEVNEGMIIYTDTKKVHELRRFVLGLMLEGHNGDCLSCDTNGNCRLQDLCYEYDVIRTQIPFNEKKIILDNPYFTYDEGKCILCCNCVRMCKELQGAHVLNNNFRGLNTKVGLPFEMDFSEAGCENCGNCISVCPTGALSPKSSIRFRLWEAKKTRTTCAYCGVGCQMNLLSKNGQVVGAKQVNEGLGLLCVKGKFAFNFINHSDRLTVPLIRKNGVLTKVTWDEALTFVAKKIVEVKSKYGANAIGGLASAKSTNEDNYLFMKLMRGAIGTNNIDHCARLCHASTVAALADMLGSAAMTNPIEDVLKSNVIFITGSNTIETHPVIGALIRRAKKSGAKLIVAEPRKVGLAKEADIFLKIKPGTNIALFNGMMSAIINENLEDNEYIEERTEGISDLKQFLKDFTPQKAADICNIETEDLIEAAKLYAKADNASIYYAMGVTQHTDGTHGVMSLCNLALLTGNIGKPGGGINPLRGQNNVQGACDMGCLPGDFTGYQKVSDPDTRAKFSEHWNTKLSLENGLTATEMIDAAGQDSIKLMYIMGENPLVSEPDTNHTKEALNACEFIIVQDIFLTETAQIADVVLPANTFAEKEGTFTNTERRVQQIHAAIPSVGSSKPDYEIIDLLLKKLDFQNNCHTPKEIMKEIAELTPQYGGISYERLENESLCWPCKDNDHHGTPILHVDQFTHGKKAVFRPCTYTISPEIPDTQYPFLLTTGRTLRQYHTMTMTDKTPAIMETDGKNFIEINPLDAQKLYVCQGECVQVLSERGKIKANVKITADIGEGVIFMPFHFGANILTNTLRDPIAKIPGLKLCTVNIKKMEDGIEK